MTSPQTGRPSNAPHRVAVCDFSEGYVRCECGTEATVTADPVYDRDEALAAAYFEHRKSVGAYRSKFRGGDPSTPGPQAIHVVKGQDARGRPTYFWDLVRPDLPQGAAADAKVSPHGAGRRLDRPLDHEKDRPDSQDAHDSSSLGAPSST